MHTERSIRSRKRPLSQQLSADASPNQTRKKRKVKHPSGSQLPAAFWDNLSEIWLTHNALQELDRRNKQAPANVSPKHNPRTFQEGATWYRNGRDWAKEQRDEAIRRANEKATQNIIRSSAVNTSFSTVCEVSSTESITEQSYFSFSGTNTIETHSLQSTRSLSPKPSQEE
ncbi:hypothetical protein TSTA_068120 [Talaromyces stipitatus ATCC 10500]|uniref:Uncharacterized protein n=1 Tax=Talaromyces stipitatus (strain ATCC 10500 / CBS 375.48 / QM 6759 / NRRL 1006) TaxID=441959 RepID=B8LYM7_TALSN|nr:uncharacterized protein TSTA_068120 [Talaromyces stipitatus ATCC 10500]EED23385.1 hypothetical protein TSTA_068120 [Talaromyces stipitatus ATCC 10500]